MLNLPDAGNRIAEFAGLLANPMRAKILYLLAKERGGMTTMDICTRFGQPEPRVSSNLAILLDGGVVSVQPRGRQRVYTLSSERVASLVNGIASLSAPREKKTSAGGRREVRDNLSIRQCRSCYDHLAGVAGVELLAKMLELGWLKAGVERREGMENRELYRLTPLGSSSLRQRGVDVERASGAKRAFAYGCLDWTERRPHLGGSLGRAVLDSMLSKGVVRRRPGTRALKTGKPVSAWLERA